jgi:acetyltransferase-like isoleucine patch superfamily enzyme
MSALKSVLRGPWRAAMRVLAMLRAIGLSIRFLGRRVSVGRGSWVAASSRVVAAGGGRITIGERCEIHPLAMILAYGGDVKLGDDCSVNPFAVLYGHGGLTIGNRVRIAAQVVIIPANHNPAGDGLGLNESGVNTRGIRIDDDVWIGAGARILDGVHIGQRAIVGAGSVVTRSIEAGATVAGVPARPLKSHHESKQ